MRILKTVTYGRKRGEEEELTTADAVEYSGIELLVRVVLTPRDAVKCFLDRRAAGVRDAWDTRRIFLFIGLPVLLVNLVSQGLFAAIFVVPFMLYLVLYLSLLSFVVSVLGTRGMGRRAFRDAFAVMLWAYAPILVAAVYDALSAGFKDHMMGPGFTASSQVLFPMLSGFQILISFMDLQMPGIGSFDVSWLVAGFVGIWSIVITSRMLGELYKCSAWFGLVLLLVGWFGSNVLMSMIGGIVQVVFLAGMAFG